MRLIAIIQTYLHSSNGNSVVREGINLSMLLYRSTSATAACTKLASSAFCWLVSVGKSSPRSSGMVETVAQAKAAIIVQIVTSWKFN